MDGKIILITGGSSGIGYACAKTLSKDNKVVLVARNEEALKKASEELKCGFEICDISDFKSVADCQGRVEKKVGKIDILINNAGIWLNGPLEDNDYSGISDVIDINLKGQIFMTKAFLPLLRKSDRGLIINTISDAGKTVKKELSVYNASKWGLEGFSKAMKEELEGSNVKIISIYPGGTKTPLFDRANAPRDQSKHLKPEILAQLIKENIRLYFDEDTIVDEIRLRHLK